MTRTDFIKACAEKCQMTQSDMKEVLVGIREVIVDGMKKGDEVKAFDGIIFKTRHMEGRKGRNPQTGEEIMIAAKNIPAVKFGKNVKEAVN